MPVQKRLPACVGVFGGEYDVKGAVRSLAEEIWAEGRNKKYEEHKKERIRRFAVSDVL